jgi:hypothetical protein
MMKMMFGLRLLPWPCAANGNVSAAPVAPKNWRRVNVVMSAPLQLVAAMIRPKSGFVHVALGADRRPRDTTTAGVWGKQYDRRSITERLIGRTFVPVAPVARRADRSRARRKW